MERKDRQAAALHFASLASGSFGLVLVALGLKSIRDKWEIFAKAALIEESIGKFVWVEGEVVSDDGFKPKTIQDHSLVVSSKYLKSVSFNLVNTRVDEFREKTRNFKILTGDKEVKIFNNNISHSEQIFEEIQPIKKGIFSWIKTLLSIFLIFTKSPPVLQDHLVKITESVISLNSIYQVFGLLKSIKGEYFIEPSIITNKKDQVIKKELTQIFFYFSFSLIFFCFSYTFQRIRKRLLDNEKKVIAPKNMICIVCKKRLVSCFYEPCKHMSTCNTCHNRRARSGKLKCPFCDNPFNRCQIINK